VPDPSGTFAEPEEITSSLLRSGSEGAGETRDSRTRPDQSEASQVRRALFYATPEKKAPSFFLPAGHLGCLTLRWALLQGTLLYPTRQ
jgi:hypothetical protein